MSEYFFVEEDHDTSLNLFEKRAFLFFGSREVTFIKIGDILSIIFRKRSILIVLMVFVLVLKIKIY